MIKQFHFISIIIFSFLLLSCNDKDEMELPFQNHIMEIPKGFPEIEFPSDNEYSIARWSIGKKLFYDPILSKDSTKNCASCHKANLAFSDDTPFSDGVDDQKGTRNSPTLANVAYHPYYTREGGVPTLEMQILVPIQEHNEFDFNIVLIAELLQKDSIYITMAKDAYDRMPDAFVITRALANFERSLISGYSRYDQYVNYKDKTALNKSEIRGMDLFFSDKTKCSNCHSGFNFTNYAFENNGLYEDYPDNGRQRLTEKEEDLSLFKVPTLRNIGLTTPFMHDGSLKTLDAVIEHYRSGGKNHPNKSAIIQPLDITDQEKQDLIQFLNSLTDQQFITNINFRK